MPNKIKQIFNRLKRAIPGFALDIADLADAGNPFNGVKTKSKKVSGHGKK